jgi:hypothetical protein
MSKRKIVELVRKQTAIALCRRCRKAFDLFDWLKLRAIGDQRWPEEARLPLELRNCACGTTIAARFDADDEGCRFYLEREIVIATDGSMRYGDSFALEKGA